MHEALEKKQPGFQERTGCYVHTPKKEQNNSDIKKKRAGEIGLGNRFVITGGNCVPLAVGNSKKMK